MNNFPKVLIFRPGTAENSAVGRADKEIPRGTVILRMDFFGHFSNQDILEFDPFECAKRCVSSRSTQEK